MCLNGGQILNSMALPFFMVAPTKLSMEWFPASQRTTITAISAVSCEVGFAASFFIPNLTTSITDIMSHSLSASITCLFMTLSLSCIPNRPLVPPSSGAAFLDEISKNDSRNLQSELGFVFRNHKFLWVAGACGLGSGVWTGWCPELPAVVAQNYKEREADTLSLVANLATIYSGRHCYWTHC